MDRRLLGGLWGAAFLVLSAMTQPAPAAADPVSLYIRKTQVTCIERSGKVYAPASALLKALGYQWSVNGSTVTLAAGAAGGPAMAAGKACTFVLPSGKTATVDLVVMQKEAWVAVRPIAEAAGGTYVATPAAGIVQVVFSSAAISQKDLDRAVRDSRGQQGISAPPLVGDSGSSSGGSTSTPADASGKTPAGDKKTTDDASASDKKEEVIKVSSLDYTNPVIPGSNVPAEVRGSATIKNTGEQRITNVKFTVELRDLGDNLITTLPTKFISAMEPGETASQDFLWYNYYNQTVTPKVKIEHDDPPKKKEKKTDAKSGESGSETLQTPPSGGK